MKLRYIMVSIIIVFIMAPLTIYASEPASRLDKLDQISDEALQMMKTSRYEDAQKLLQYFSDQFLLYTMDEHFFSMDELRIVTVAHNEALEAAKSENMGHKERMNKVTKFRLVMDAITSTHQPLWTEMEGSIMSVFGGVKEAVYNGNSESFHTNFNSFLALYEVIYPSIRLDIDAERIQKLDAQIALIDHYRPRVLSKDSSQEELEALESSLRSIFDEMNEDDADPSLWWVMITTGSIILVTLSYVGWRKYRGEKERKREKD